MICFVGNLLQVQMAVSFLKKLDFPRVFYILNKRMFFVVFSLALERFEE